MKVDPLTLEHARQLRKELTPAEAVLWREFRGRRFAGFRFRRQHPIGSYIVDFYCASIGLAVELDGESHLPRAAHDGARDAWLASQGVTILRFWNTQVFEESEAVFETIFRKATLLKK